MTRHSLACILPPDLLLRLSQSADADRQVAILQTLELDHSFRLARAESAGRLGMRLAATTSRIGAGTPNRQIFDQRHATAEEPGKLIRAEGDEPAADASINQAYDNFGYTFALFWEVFHRDSIDDQGMQIQGLVHFGTDYDNAFWDGAGHMFFGDGDGQYLTDTTRGTDVVGHELTHGVTQNEANLIYRGQSGALNESISDVFGSLVKQYHLGQTADQADWLIGADIVGPQLAPALRSMKEPGKANPHDNQPATMDDYVQTASDNGGVHTNSGIPNHAFYTVATQLGGHAWERAGQIWYDALTSPQLRPETTFAKFAGITLRQARLRFGAGSAEADAVKAGWEAAKVRVR